MDSDTVPLGVNHPQEELAVAHDLPAALVRTLGGEAMFWSEGGQRLYGWSSHEVIGRRVHQLLRTRFQEPLWEIHATLTDTGSWSGILTQETKDCRQISVATQWVLQPSLHQNQPLVLELYVENLGLRSNLAPIIDSTGDAIIGETLDGLVTIWNASAQKLFGYSAAEMIGQPITVLFPPELAAEEARLIDVIRSGSRVKRYETTRISKSGKRLDVSVTLSPIFDHAGDLIGVSKIVRDISRERAHQREVFLATERQRLAAEAGRVGLWSLDISTGRVDWSDRHKVLYGLDPNDESPTLAEVMSFVHPEDEPMVKTAMEAVMEQDSELLLEFRIIRRDGWVRWISTTGKLHRDANGTHNLLLGASIDFTERRLNEDALRQANASLEEFAYAAAHDLQEPLRNISLSLQQFVRSNQELLPDEHIMTAVSNSVRMQALIRDLLAFSRAIDSPASPVQTVDANVVVADVIQNLRHAIEEARAEVLISGSLPAVPMHYAHLLQVLQNLIGNALKYRSVDPLIVRVSAVSERSNVTLSISDNGIGILPQYHKRIFGIFRRLNRTEPGNGIGLAVCKRIVEHYGGTIGVSSHKGCGATFFFSIPYSRT